MEPGRTVGERGTEMGEQRAESGRKIQKGKLSLFATAYIQSRNELNNVP